MRLRLRHLSLSFFRVPLDCLFVVFQGRQQENRSHFGGSVKQKTPRLATTTYGFPPVRCTKGYSNSPDLGPHAWTVTDIFFAGRQQNQENDGHSGEGLQKRRRVAQLGWSAHRKCENSEFSAMTCDVRNLGPPVVPFSPFFSEEGSPTKIDHIKIGYPSPILNGRPRNTSEGNRVLPRPTPTSTYSCRWEKSILRQLSGLGERKGRPGEPSSST